jgi:hypothetical protein
MQTARALVIAALTAATAADAAPDQTQPAKPRPWTGYIRVPRVQPPTAKAASKIVFVKRCFGNCDVFFAPVDDSRTGASSIAQQGGTRRIGDFTQDDAVWQEMMACVKTTFAPFDLTITDVKPPDTSSYYMNMVGGKPTDLRSDITNAGGVAPFDCGEIPNAITYTFDVYGPDPESLCWTVAQEIAHAFGLEHEFLQKDPMTYLAGDMPKRFRDVDAPCGELEQFARCDCRSTPQNSYRHIVNMFGPGVPTPPELTIKFPIEGKATQPGFVAVAHALDDVRIDRVELFVDGTMVTQATMSFGDQFELPTTDFGAGPHTLEIRAYDVQGVVQTQTMDFTQGPPCTKSTVCTGADVCVSGVCVAGPETPGGLGSVCSTDNECVSHRCVSGGEGSHKYCVDECSVGNAQSCPDEFSCIAAGDEGVCWPTPGGGCCDAGTGPQGPILLALGLGVLILRRRARPSR